MFIIKLGDYSAKDKIDSNIQKGLRTKDIKKTMK